MLNRWPNGEIASAAPSISQIWLENTPLLAGGDSRVGVGAYAPQLALIVSTTHYGCLGGLGLARPGSAGRDPANVLDLRDTPDRRSVRRRLPPPAQDEGLGARGRCCEDPGTVDLSSRLTRTDGAPRRGIGDSRKTPILTRFGHKSSQVIWEVRKSQVQYLAQVYCKLEASRQQVVSKSL